MRRATIEKMWNGCSEMRKRERKKRGEIQNEDGREIRNGYGREGKELDLCRLHLIILLL
jgi:hypothetical protein